MRTQWMLPMYQKDSYSVRCTRKGLKIGSRIVQTDSQDSSRYKNSLMKSVLERSWNTSSSGTGLLQTRNWLYRCQSSDRWTDSRPSL